MAAPEAGDVAPDFELPAHTGGSVRLSALKGRPVVVFFYPKDFTSVCTKEVCGFRDVFQELQAAGVEVLGVSRDSLDSHQRFADAHKLPYKLLADVDGAVHEIYGAAPVLGLLPKRATFVVDKNGVVQAVVRSLLDASKHVDGALAALR